MGRLCSVLVVAMLGLILPPHTAHTAPLHAPAEGVPVVLTPWEDNDGAAARPGLASFDGNGDAFSAAGLPAPGLVSLGGIPFLFPEGGVNVVAFGQTIPITPGHYRSAYVLTAAAWGELVTDVTIHYADGSAGSAVLTSPDWHLGPETGAVTEQQWFSWTAAQRGASSLYSEELSIDPMRTAVAITLPTTQPAAYRSRSVHLFALTLQPIVPGLAVAVSAGRSTTRTLQGGSQVVQATVENIGTTWITPSDPVAVSTEGTGLLTVRPARITLLAPGEEVTVEMGVKPPAHGTLQATGTIVARAASGESGFQQVTLRIGLPVYRPTEASLSQHEAPDWYNNAKFGIFIHYGVYSVPAWAPVGGVYAEWYWNSMQQRGSATYQHQLQTFGPFSTYDDFIKRFTARKFDPHAWVELFKAAGARYFVFVTKHHDGFALFHTTRSRRNSVQMGPHKDLVAMLFAADRRYTPQIHPGVYYSLPEWYNPAFPGINGKKGHFPGGPPRQYVTGKPIPYRGYTPVSDYVTQYQVPQLDELIDQYHPDLLWCDIGGPNDSLAVLAHLYNDAANPAHARQVAANNRCGVNVHDFTTPEYRAYSGVVRAKWETSRGIDPHSYGYNSATPVSAYAGADALIAELVDVVSKNGNLLLDIGPRADGSIPAIMQRRLRQIGAWLKVNGEAIYGTTYWWRTPQEGDLRFTVRPNRAFYITSLVKPGAQLTVHQPVPIRQGDTVTLLGTHPRSLRWSQTKGVLTIRVPAAAVAAGKHAWVFKVAWK